MRQKRISPPVLYNIFANFMFKEALGDISACITIGEENIKNILYADDIVMLGESEATEIVAVRGGNYM